ncbi:phosphoglycerate kinase, partial [Bacteroides caccae]|uniref:phosphoglycerate kinase n=1 Tax=Bacteroides caccae TaxID=47678 RepID=UPI001D064409
ALRMLAEAKANNCEILLPVDLVVAAAFAADAPNRTVGIDAVPADMMALDVGPDTVAMIEARLRQASTLVW